MYSTLLSVYVTSWASLIDQLVKNLPAMQETWVQSLGWKDALEKGKATHSSILAWKIPQTVESMGWQKAGHNWASPFLGARTTEVSGSVVIQEQQKQMLARQLLQTDTVLSALLVSVHLPLTTSLRCGQYCYPHFTKKATKAQSVCDLLRVTQLQSGRARFVSRHWFCHTDIS